MRRVPPGGNFIPISGDAAAWARGLSSVFVELEFEQVDPQQKIHGRMYSTPFGDLTFVRAVTRGGAHRVIRSRALIDKSSHNNFFVGFLLAGEAVLTQGDHRAELHTGDIAILDSSREYAIDVPRNFDALWIRVPRYRLEGRLHALSDIMAQRIDGSAGTGHVASNMLAAALAEAPRISETEGNRIANHLLDLLALSLADRIEPAASDRTSAYRQSTLRRLHEYIEDRLDDETLSPELVAQAHGVSSRYVSKLFEREGTSVARWIRMRRLERCRIDLESPENAQRSVSDIAYHHGFGNISSFNRAFRAHFGLAPRALRSGDRSQ